MAIFVLTVFLVSIAPTAFAQTISARMVRPTGDNMTVTAVSEVSGAAKAVRAEKPVIQSVAARKIAVMNTEQFREQKEVLLQKAIEKCSLTDAPEECSQNLQQRVETVKNLGEKALERVQTFEERKLNKVAGFRELQEDEDFKVFNKENAFKARTIAASKITEAKQDYLAAKGRFTMAKQRFDETTEKFARAKERVNECEGNEDEECQIAREEIRIRAQEHVSNIADTIIEHLNQVRNRIESNEDLSEEDAAEMIDEVESYIEEIEDAKETILTSESKEEVLEAVNNVRDRWQNMQNRLGVIVGNTVNARVGGIIVQSEQLQIKLERILERMAENGRDTDSIETLVDEFGDSIEEAKADYKAAIGKFREAKDMETPGSALVQEGHNLMKEAHAALKEAQSKLREIVLAIKQAGGSVELEGDESEEALALADEEVVLEEGTEEVSE